eukprot:CAMPEP_0181405772 /NCGR_PEP_ID=MMETSP1110-20121109/4929_1 /TAXON_ID=174948 /ORGANISM="Symbiodinium sp., Strain CCMP421" /LENGTH=90 /DNA_ID=CAMNT_0023528165 /DNA_START=22 /DNA_END=291 /DNA_ORIENTATION=-
MFSSARQRTLWAQGLRAAAMEERRARIRLVSQKVGTNPQTAGNLPARDRNLTRQIRGEGLGFGPVRKLDRSLCLAPHAPPGKTLGLQSPG